MKAHHRGGNQSPLIHRYTNRNRRRSCNPNRDRHVHVVGVRWSAVLVIACFHIPEVPNMLNVHAVCLSLPFPEGLWMGWFEKRIAENHGLFVDTCEGHQQGYEWVDPKVKEHFSKYSWLLIVWSFIESIPLLCDLVEDDIITIDCITAKLEGDSNQADLFRQIRLQIITGEKEMVVENPPTNDQKVEVMEAVRDLQPSPAEEKKHKRKEKPSQHNFPSQFPKRKRTSSSGNSSALMLANLRMRDGLSISLTTSELEVVDNSNREALLESFLEFQSRAIVVARHLGADLKNNLMVELESAKSDLANAQKRIDEMSHKESLLNKELDKLKREKLNLLTNCSSWETWCLQAENEEEEAKAKITQLKQDLSDMTSARADDRRKLASELFQLKKCLLAQHEEGFAKALRQAALLFKIPPDDDRFGVDQDVYHGKLVSINDIPYGCKHC
ncbi:hypothetical protein DEO72_LG2g4703 [Vigna unguiculata]|uniref:Uncharacterized protein n=1 Tax=Vigna unguiculata TaxID=3917 RepID=A0A4D6L753_VIGUN|nr:hypothetical protein DEO72_LG2g4703 [Vigna unguiculata]